MVMQGTDMKIADTPDDLERVTGCRTPTPTGWRGRA